MTNERYDILFDGQLTPASEPAIVKARLAELFKTDLQKIDRLFGGKPVTIKKNLDEAMALKYQTVLEQAGAIVTLQPVSEQAVTDIKPSRDREAAKASNEEGFSVAPVGTELLREEEKQHIPDVDVDTSAIHLAELGPLPGSHQDAPPAPDTSHLSTAEPGADLLPEKPAQPEPVKVDISHMEVAPVGERLTEIREEQEWDLPDISQLELGPEGDESPLQPPKQFTATPPDTSHLSVDD